MREWRDGKAAAPTKMPLAQLAHVLTILNQGRQGRRADQDVSVHAAGHVFALFGRHAPHRENRTKDDSPITPYLQHKARLEWHNPAHGTCVRSNRVTHQLPKPPKPTKDTPDQDMSSYIAHGVMVCNDHKKRIVRHHGVGYDRGVAHNARDAQPVRGAI